MVVAGKHIVLGVTGSIAAYKAVELASQLTKEGAVVEVIMTNSAMEFVAPLTFSSITGRTIATDLFDPNSEYSIAHVKLARQADAVLIAPATANTIAKLAYGMADDLLTCTVLATEAPVLLAPAMDGNMYENPVTQENVAKLTARGFTIIDPEFGRLASGAQGRGRLATPDMVIGTLRKVLGKNGDLAGKKVVVSAGGTQEPIDPVRFIGNPSSGKMGYAVAEAARDRGAEVTLVSAPVSLSAPPGIKIVKVKTAIQMRDAVLKAVADVDALVMTAAVADYRSATTAEHKIKKDKDEMTVQLVMNPDILGTVAEVRAKTPSMARMVVVGFAAESQDLIENASKKLASKNLDMVCANDITAADAGFAVDTNRVILVDRSGDITRLPLMMKTEVADTILDRVVQKLAQKKDLVLA